MRNIPANALTKLATDLGTEPVVILQVDWGGDGGVAYYADKAIPGTPVQGRITDLSGFDEAVKVTGDGQSAQITVTLSDTDGVLKAIYNRARWHKRTVRVWQWFEGLNFTTEKFLLFRGLINSPVIWDEGTRSFTFSVVNRIEDVEVGFSAEEGAFTQLPEELIGKPFPLCFGTVINVPALKAVPAISGTLAGGVGIKDFTLSRRITLADAITCPQTPIGFRCSGAVSISNSLTCNIAYEEDHQCQQSKCLELERLRLEYAEQSAYEYAQITVFGGKKFPQGRRITLNINGGLFTGQFTGTKTAPTNVFQIVSRQHPRDDGTGQIIIGDAEAEIRSRCPGEPGDAGDSDTQALPLGTVYTGIRSSRLSWEAYRREQAAGFFWAGGGSTVTMHTANEIIYIANLLPSTILRVAAWRTINGNRFLLTVPRRFYTVRQVNYGGYQVMEIVFQRPLSTEQQDTGGGWTDEVYVSLTSSVGPNTIDILRWFIEKYTSYSIDSSFAATKPKLTAYPMNFALLTRKNLLTVLEEIASKARCALWQKDDTFHILYLPEEPTPVASIGEDDILAGTLQIELTKTEDLATVIHSKWRKDYAAEKDNTYMFRHNVKLYGTHKRTEDYYQYNDLQLVRKSTTFWGIRWSQTWKRIKFSTSLEFLHLEAFDAVTFTLPDVGNGSFIGIIEKAVYNSAERQIDFEAWTPILEGTMTPYNFAFPAGIAEHALYPTIDERNAGQAGSGTEPNFSTIAPPGHPLRTSQTGIFQGFSLSCNGATVLSSANGVCRQDFGDMKPSDIGDVAPGVDVIADDTGDISGGSSPITGNAGTGFFSGSYKLSEDLARIYSEAAKGRENAQRAVDAGDADAPQTKEGQELKDFLDSLPDPDDLDPDKYPCQIRVTINGQKLSTHSIGTNPFCLFTGPVFTEVVVFNSRIAANEFIVELPGQKNCTTTFPCTQCINAVISGGNCEPPEGEEPAIIGYSNSTGSASNHSFLFN